MKQLLWLFITLLIVACSSEPVGNTELFSPGWIKKHAIQSITQSITMGNNSLGDVISYPYLHTVYNKNGLPISQLEYTPEGVVTESIRYEYDKHGNLTQELSLYPVAETELEFGGIRSGTQYFYQNKTQQKEIIFYQDTLNWEDTPPMTLSDLTQVERHEFDYDAQDDLKEELKYLAGETKPYEIVQYEYVNNQLSKMVTVNNANIADTLIYYLYDDRGILVQTRSYLSNRKSDEKVPPDLIFAVKYEYDAEGNIVLQHEYTPNKYRLSNGEAVDENVVIERAYNSLGDLAWQNEVASSRYFPTGEERVETVHEYDSHDKLILIKVVDPSTTEYTHIRIDYEQY